MHSFFSNIGLIKLPSAVVLSDYVQPIPLSCAPTPIGADAIAMGFGFLKNDQMPQNLQFTKLKTVGLQECKQDTQKLISKNGIVCASETNTVLCHGDLGDPLVSSDTGKLIGVTIYALGDCQVGDPQGFIGISAYIEWIGDVIDGVLCTK